MGGLVFYEKEGGARDLELLYQENRYWFVSMCGVLKLIFSTLQGICSSGERPWSFCTKVQI